MLLKYFLKNRIIAAYSLLNISSLSAEMFSNKFDILALTSASGISGHNEFSGSGFKNTMETNFAVSTFFLDSGSSWASDGIKTSKYPKPSSGSSTSNYGYGIFEEHGYWNVAGLYFGFSDIAFSRPKVEVAKKNNFTNEDVKNTYSSFLYYAPEGYSFNNLKDDELSAAHAGKGLGKLPPNALSLIDGEMNWTSDKYGHYYQAFLKNIGITDQVPYGIIDDKTVETYVAPSLPSITYSVPDGLTRDFLPGGFKSLEEGIKNFQVILNPSFSKYGCRLSGNVSPYPGINLLAKLGFSEILSKSTIFEGIPTALSTPLIVNKKLLDLVLNDLGATLDEYSQKGPEDSTVSITAGQGFILKDEDGDVVGTMSPFVVGAVSLPTSKKYAESQGNKYLFYMPMGNEGHTGYSISAGLNFDFKDMFTISFAGGATIFNNISIKNYRMPNHKDQVGFYPFKIDISRKKGNQYFCYASLKSGNSDGSGYFYSDILYTTHKNDSITLHDSSAARNTAFEDGRLKMEALSSWSSTEFNLGGFVKLSQNVLLGVNVGTNINGNFVPRARSLCVTTTFQF